MNKGANFFAVFLLILMHEVRADESAVSNHKEIFSKFGATVGGAFDLGTLKNSGLNQPSRIMNALSLEGLVGYRLNHWTIGPDFDYRWEGQLTSLSSSGGTNLKGRGWLLGLGAKYDINAAWSVQGAIDFVGKYSFSKQTDSSEDDNLSSPLVIRAKAQYFAFQQIPLSIDADLQYVSYAKWHVKSVDYSSSTNGFLVGIGLTWHFSDRRTGGAIAEQTAGGNVPNETSKKPEQVVMKEVVIAPPGAISETQMTSLKVDLAKIVDVKETESGLMVNVKGDASFAPSSTELTPESKNNLAKTAAILAKNGNVKFRIEGHSDASGQKVKNQKLSEARAQSVKKVLVDNGLKAENVSASGLGDTKPIASNKTAKGRAANRRVEIYIERTN